MVTPLIEAAEKYETAALHEHEDHPDRLGRNSITEVTTVVTANGFAAVLLGVISLSGRRLDIKRGALWGLSAFGCIGVAPALGLPPQPPGTAVADLAARQLWWLGTVVATGIGVYWIIGAARRPLRIAGGVACLLLPHLIGAPMAVGEKLVRSSLVRQFEVASLAASGVFWLTLGAAGGFFGSDRP